MACGCQNKNNENQPTEEENGLVNTIKKKIEDVKRLWKESDDEKSEE